MEIFLRYILFTFLINIAHIKSSDTKYFNDEKEEFKYDEIIAYLNFIKKAPDFLKWGYLNKGFVSSIEENINVAFLNPLIEDLFLNETNTYIMNLSDTLKIEKNGKYALDYLINCLNSFKVPKNFDINDIFYNLQNFFDYPGMDKLYEYLKNFNDIIYSLFELFMKKTIFSKFFEILEPILYKYKMILFDYAYEIIKVYNDTDKLTEISFNFATNYKNTFFFDLNKTLSFSNISIFEEIAKLSHFQDDIPEKIKNGFLKSPTLKDLMFFLLDYKEFHQIMFTVLKNYQNVLFLFNYMPNALRVLINEFKNDPINNKYFEEAKDRILKEIVLSITFEDFSKVITIDFMSKVKQYYNESKFSQDISQSCRILMNKTYFSQKQKLTFFYFKKFLLDSTKVKNDFLTYENCLYKTNLPETEYLEFNITPAFIIGIVDDVTNKNKFKDSSLKEKYNYLASLCLPYGTYFENNETKIMCSENDYNNFMKVVLSLNYDMNTTNINIINMHDNSFKSKNFVNGILSIIFVFIPLFIRLFLFIYKNIKTIGLNSNNIDKFNPPKSYKYLLKYFDIENNINELFNFNSVETNYNNLNGLIYIKGLLGISMIFYIFGQIYLILFNIPIRTINQVSFLFTMNNPLFGIISSSLRYVPRIIFSCSGYILTYKFLCFIEQNPNYYFFKFLFLQSYKYILLFFSLIFMKYSLYDINIILNRRKTPFMELYKYNLKDDKFFFIKLFSFLLFNTGSYEFLKIQNLVQYYYLPINEIFFFIFGTLLISIGYKFKLRIDYIIFTCGFFIYFSKILIYIIILDKKDYYSTQYYYLYGYGEIMTNPMFNLPYYLMGMYFGLINFCIQKGISLHKSNNKASYKMIELFETNNELNSLNDLNKIDRNTNYSIEIKSNNDSKEEFDDKIKEMPFLIVPLKFLNYHKKYGKKYCYRLIIIIFIFFIVISIFIKQVVLFVCKGKYIEINELLPLEHIIIGNNFLKIFYLLDIELIVFMINWILFVIYSKSEKVDILEFFNSQYWSICVKSYFSFSIISTNIIISVFYQNETVIEFNSLNIAFFYCLNIIFIFFGVVLFYSCFEFPLKKIFKSFFIKEEIINIEKEKFYNQDEDNSVNNEENYSKLN